MNGTSDGAEKVTALNLNVPRGVLKTVHCTQSACVWVCMSVSERESVRVSTREREMVKM
jgi:hypothetical protein